MILAQDVRPLAGLKVVELGTYVVVPNTARILSEWGAEVVKVESPNGDDWRGIGPRLGMPGEENPLFTSQNANKKFISVNLKSEDGMQVMHRLLSWADVFVTNVRLASLAKMGLDYNSVKDTYPQLIYAHFSGYGTKGPLAAWPGFDFSSYWARSGAMIDFVNKGDTPMRPISGFGDSTTASILTSGVLAAVLGRQQTGKGTLVTSSLYSAAMWYCAAGVVSGQPQYDPNGFPVDYLMEPEQPANNAFQCADGEWIFFSYVPYDSDFKTLCTALYLDEYAEDERFSTMAQVTKKENIRLFMEILRTQFKTRTSDEWSQRMAEYDIVHQKLMHMADVHKDEQAWANDYLQNHTYPTGNTVAFPNVPVQFSNYPSHKDIQPPTTIGRDTAEILEGLGVSGDEIERLKKEKAVR